MKKMLALIIFTSLLCACASNPVNNSVSEQSGGGFSETETSETPGETVKDYPVVTGSFIQPFAILSFDESKMTRHLKGLLEAGIDTVILQWCCMTPYGKYADVYFDYGGGDEYKSGTYSDRYSGMTETLLACAEELGMKVFVGLNNADEWWSKGPSDSGWNQKQAEIGVLTAQTIYTAYKSKYPGALYGWYYVWEMSNGSIMRWPVENAGLLNLYLDTLTEIDPSMPLMLSPFISEADGSAEQLGESLKQLFAAANFRAGDIYCCQDSVGAGYMSLSKLPDYFAAVGEAVKTKSGLLFWANDENFVQATWTAAPVARFINQMKAAKDYVSGFVTFSYTHYYSPDMVGTSVYHDMYIEYMKTGLLPNDEIPGKPEIEISEITGRDALSLAVDAVQNTYGVAAVKVTINGHEYKTAENGDIRAGKVYRTSFYIDLSAYSPGETLLVEVRAFDVNGTSSEISSLTYTKGGEVN